MNIQFANVEEAVERIALGGVVIVLDSEDRENEGDFVAAAEAVTPQMIHFMISEGRGQLCLALLPDVASRLGIRLMVSERTDPRCPRFAVPLDHITSSTGISPWERAHTIRKVLDPYSRPEDFIQPGHIFPLIAEEGGVLKRTGHTESSVELARLAGLTPMGLLCEVCSSDGLHMADRDELLKFGQEHDVPVVTIDAIVAHVQRYGNAPLSVTRQLQDTPAPAQEVALGHS